LIRTYCLTCHNETLKTADLVLDKLDNAGLPTDPAIGEKVLKKLRTDAMPPAGRRRPDPVTRAAFVSQWKRRSTSQRHRRRTRVVAPPFIG
jgi:hypothetical protein